MEINYKWTCSVCDSLNRPEDHYCLRCNSAAELSAVEIEERQFALANGIRFNDKLSQPPEPRTPLGKISALAVSISMGQNQTARQIGTISFYTIVGVMLLSLVIVAPNIQSHIPRSIGCIFCAFEVKNFCIGKTTYIDRLATKATPSNTFLRWLGFVFDLGFLIFLLTL